MDLWPKTPLVILAGLLHGPDSSQVVGAACALACPATRGGLESAIDVRLAEGLLPATDSAFDLAAISITALAERMYQLQHTRLRMLTASIGRALVKYCSKFVRTSGNRRSSCESTHFDRPDSSDCTEIHFSWREPVSKGSRQSMPLRSHKSLQMLERQLYSMS